MHDILSQLRRQFAAAVGIDSSIGALEEWHAAADRRFLEIGETSGYRTPEEHAAKDIAEEPFRRRLLIAEDLMAARTWLSRPASNEQRDIAEGCLANAASLLVEEIRR